MLKRKKALHKKFKMQLHKNKALLLILSMVLPNSTSFDLILKFINILLRAGCITFTYMGKINTK